MKANIKYANELGALLAHTVMTASNSSRRVWEPRQGEGHRARQRFVAANWAYDWIYRSIAHIRSRKTWPDVIFFPRLVVKEFMLALMGEKVDSYLRFMNNDITRAFSFDQMLETGTMFSTWRITQGIYRFDETLYSELIQTKISGEIPADVLLHLPEWCIYIETPGMKTPRDGNIYGAWARIDLTSDGYLVLVIMLDSDLQNTTIFSTQKFMISRGSIEESIRATLDIWFTELKEDEKQDIVANSTSWAHPIINLLLYLCSGADYGEGSPRNPVPVRTKRGPRIFAANKLTTWNVGVRMGAALRAAYAAREPAEGGDGDGMRSVRPHIRRAHWHGFRSGPRLGADGEPIPAKDRPVDLRWLPPIPVNIGSEELPAVIRPVKFGLNSSSGH